MSDARHWTGDIDHREFTDPDSPDRHEPNWDCGCHCAKCFRRLVQVYGHYAPCEECEGGESLDGDALRGEEAQELMRDEQIDVQRLK